MASSTAYNRLHRGLTGLVLLTIIALAPGCDAVGKLRSFLNGQEMTGAALRVEVTPKEGIRILLDGQELSQTSPFQGDGFNEGTHELEVRGLGYHTVKLPITLTAGKLLTVPVALRGGAPAIIPTPKGVEVPPPEPPAPPLPYGVSPVALTVAATPDVPVLLDGTPITGRQLKLERVFGTLTAGPLSVRYRLGGAGLLELTIPEGESQATWTRDNAILLPGNSFRLHQGVMRLTRVAPDGSGQTVLLKR